VTQQNRAHYGILEVNCREHAIVVLTRPAVIIVEGILFF
jgi:hypothetical protein